MKPCNHVSIRARARTASAPVLAVLVVLAMAVAMLASTLAPALTGSASAASESGGIYVQDKAGVLSDGTKDSIEALNKRLEKTKGHAQLLVVTIGSLPKDETIESFSMSLAEKYKPGDGKQDTGLVYVVDTGDHKDRLEVGYGLEDAIPDSMASDIIDRAHDDYKDGNWDGGVSKVLEGVEAAVKGKFPELQSKDESDEMRVFWISVGVFVVLFALGCFCTLKSGRGYGSGFSSYGSGSSFGSSSSSSSGSFGGGSFGGGGASGSW